MSVFNVKVVWAAVHLGLATVTSAVTTDLISHIQFYRYAHFTVYMPIDKFKYLPQLINSNTSPY